jgi:osmotically-inducible protein OsmY
VKTDAQLQRDVMAEIKWEPCVTATEIGVSAANGVVTLSHEAPHSNERHHTAQQGCPSSSRKERLS